MSSGACKIIICSHLNRPRVRVPNKIRNALASSIVATEIAHALAEDQKTFDRIIACLGQVPMDEKEAMWLYYWLNDFAGL